jgi:YegS/Rv2252/BmrU family lipid kinase
MMQMCPLIIVNQTAAKARQAWPIVRAELEANKIDFRLYETEKPGDATERTRIALGDGCRTVAVVGGDGTLSEAAEGFFELPRDPAKPPSPINPESVLAIFPAGTGDDFARGLIGERAPLKQWTQIFIEHCLGKEDQTVRRIDLLDATRGSNASRFICLNASTMGLGAETGARVAAQGKMLRVFSGEVRFMTAAVAALARWRERPVRVSLDDDREVIEGPMNLVAVANGLYAGGGMMLTPDAAPDDGMLDVVTVSGLTRFGIVRELPRIHSGGHVLNPKVRIARGRKVRIETFAQEDSLLIEADGNVRGRTPVDFRVLPSALRFVVRELRR